MSCLILENPRVKLPVGPTKPPRESIHARKVSALLCCLTCKKKPDHSVFGKLGLITWPRCCVFLHSVSSYLTRISTQFFSCFPTTFSAGVHGVRSAGRGLSLCDVTNLSPAAFRKFCSGSRPTAGRCSTPVPARKRRCTMAVDYTEPSLNA